MSWTIVADFKETAVDVAGRPMTGFGVTVWYAPTKKAILADFEKAVAYVTAKGDMENFRIESPKQAEANLAENNRKLRAMRIKRGVIKG
jgi:hypothetical protein